MRSILVAVMAIGLLAPCALTTSAADVEDGFTSLFNGRDLAGWLKRGGSAEYTVENGSIVGKCVPNTPRNTFLCTENEFGNFVLKLQYKFLEAGNSGVQFRSASRPEGDGQRVYGYQYEMRPGGDATGRIYDEGRRGHKFGIVWLDAYTPQDRLDAAQASCREGEWNDVEIQCIGPSIKTWLNGFCTSDIVDEACEKTGKLGLQMHGGADCEMFFKDFEVMPITEDMMKLIERK